MFCQHLLQKTELERLKTEAPLYLQCMYENSGFPDYYSLQLLLVVDSVMSFCYNKSTLKFKVLSLLFKKTIYE